MTRPPILPPLRRTAADAEAFARVVHAGQVDKAGRPYVEHLERVVRRAVAPAKEHGCDPDAIAQVAWLHDVIEDTEYGAGHLRADGYDEAAIQCVCMLTKQGDAPYRAWIEHLCATAPSAVLIVKLADMEDNSDPVRLALLPEATRERLARKYAEPLKLLRAAVERGAVR